MSTVIKKWGIVTVIFIFLQISVSVFFFLFFRSQKNETLYFHLAIILSATSIVYVVITIWYLSLFIKKQNHRILNDITHIENVYWKYGEIDIIVYNSDFVVVWTNVPKSSNSKIAIGKGIEEFIDLNKLQQKNNKDYIIDLNNEVYCVHHVHSYRMILLKKITWKEELLKKYKNERSVMGILKIENYEVIDNLKSIKTQANINALIQANIQTLTQVYNFFCIKISTNQYVIIGNFSELKRLIDDKFTFLFSFFTKLKNLHENLSISVGIGYGIYNFPFLYDIASDNLQIATNRGGGQVIIRRYGSSKKIIFGKSTSEISYGHYTNLDIKLFAKVLKDEIGKAENIIISGHKWADIDSIASTVAMAWITNNFGKQVNIVASLELFDNNNLLYLKKLVPDKEFKQWFITPAKSLKLCTKNSLIIVVDTHINNRIEEPKLLEIANKVMVVDHHLLSTANTINVRETHRLLKINSSSTSELMVQIINAISEIDTNPPVYIATLLTAGLFLDTNYFRQRTSAITFETAAMLKSWGGDSNIALEILQFNNNDKKLMYKIMAKATEILPNVYVAAASDEDRVKRSFLSVIAQELISNKNALLAVVIGVDDTGIPAVSFRGNGKVNVQALAEKLGGGGHYSAAAYQNSDMDLKTFTKTIIETTVRYVKKNKQQKIKKN